MKTGKKKRKEERKPTARAKEGIETRGHNNGGKHERDGGQCAQEGFAAKVEAGEQDRRRKAKEEGEQGGEGGLIKRKT